MRTCDGSAVQASREVSQFLRKERLAHARVFDHAGPDGHSRITRPPVLPSATRTASATGAISLSRLNSLACTIPCRRFADALADACARLGADVDRYSFIVMDLHHLILASLLAHSGLEQPARSRWRPECGELEGNRRPTLVTPTIDSPLLRSKRVARGSFTPARSHRVASARVV
jgi:hypothetical protein